jgi:primase-polymerase (primpol)-like protein
MVKWKNPFSNKKHLRDLTISNLEQQMKKEKFNENFTATILEVLKARLVKYGDAGFQEWLYELNFNIPEEFTDESLALNIYLMNEKWMEEELVKLEHETGLSWEVQAEDLQSTDMRVIKAQLVTRHRLSEIILELQR